MRTYTHSHLLRPRPAEHSLLLAPRGHGVEVSVQMAEFSIGAEEVDVLFDFDGEGGVGDLLGDGFGEHFGCGCGCGYGGYVPVMMMMMMMVAVAMCVCDCCKGCRGFDLVSRVGGVRRREMCSWEEYLLFYMPLAPS